VLAAKDAVRLLATRPNCGKPVKAYKRNCEYYENRFKNSAINGSMEKTCCKCKHVQSVSEFGKLAKSPDGLRYDCRSCRKDYRECNKDKINQKLKAYYQEHKDVLLVQNREYRLANKDVINIQRKEYRNRPDVKEHIKQKQREYLPKRKADMKNKYSNDINYRLRVTIRSKLWEALKKGKQHSSLSYLGCDLEFFKQWIEFRFDENMTWENWGSYWHIDHILPINAFKDNHDTNKFCFHWTNLQPLTAFENQSKGDKLQLHYYFNNIVNIVRFNNKYRQFLGYQAVNESLQWLRMELRYGKNPPHEDVQTSEIGNPQPSSYVRYDKDMEKVQRLNGGGSECTNHAQ